MDSALGTNDSGITVWNRLVGQADAVATLQRAVTAARTGESNSDMTHAWLLTGPPGSGRSTTAVAFAAALVCPTGGCGQCSSCHLALTNSHPDVTHVQPSGVWYKTDQARDLVKKSAMAPSQSPWHVVVLEDADRLTEAANNVLLKAIEEPTARAIWILCSPSPEDVLPTVKSRCRSIRLRLPSPQQIAHYLAGFEEIDEATAYFAARAAQGHIGRARVLAEDEDARTRRQRVLSIPGQLTDLSRCIQAARDLVATAKEDTAAITSPVDAREQESLARAWGEGAEGRGVGRGARGIKGAIKELEDQQSARRTRTERDQLDRALMDLLGYYRDVLVIQIHPAGDRPGQRPELVNEELHAEIERMASTGTPATTLARIEALERARAALEANVAAQLALEALMVDLANPAVRETLSSATRSG